MRGDATFASVVQWRVWETVLRVREPEYHVRSLNLRSHRTRGTLPGLKLAPDTIFYHHSHATMTNLIFWPRGRLVDGKRPGKLVVILVQIKGELAQIWWGGTVG